jgi:hypothetical protein
MTQAARASQTRRKQPLRPVERIPHYPLRYAQNSRSSVRFRTDVPTYLPSNCEQATVLSLQMPAYSTFSLDYWHWTLVVWLSSAKSLGLRATTDGSNRLSVWG